MNNIVCIYHKNCSDGFGAALAVKLWADKNGRKVDFLPATHGDSAPNVKGKEVLIVDFSYSRDILLNMHNEAKSLVVLDHHKTAKESLDGLNFCIFDMQKSGAVLTWEYLFPDKEVPELFLFIQDRDLWEWKLKNSREVSDGLRTLEMDFNVWSEYLDARNMHKLALKGEAIIEYNNKKIEKVLELDIQLIDILGYKVPCINATDLISEIGNRLSQGYPFAVMYFDTHDKRVYSLRSAKDGIDVSEIAKKFGGGGHFHAAGFTTAKPQVNL